ncbi:MAG: HEAT repeat domain-containing protein [Bacteroidetes bacterium]|nr:HEAT repeat domain-containing protein [Bacteroidota bacterium]
MNLADIFNDKTLKPKERTEQLSSWLIKNPNKTDELIDFAKTAKDPVKASCIEVVEYATKENPQICTTACFDFVSAALAEKSPAVKREAGRVIGNVAARFPKQLEKALTNLLNNSEHEGTVVRWSAAFAIGEIIKLKTPLNKDLIPVAEAICEREEKNSIQKIYLAAIKKAGN